MSLVSLGCPFLIVRSVFSNVYLQDKKIFLIPPFSRKWQILPGKYIQVLSISHKMADYFAFPLLL
jgi:hypothetical protein